MRTGTEVAIVAAGLTAGSMLGAPAAHASGDASWCAVTQLGEGASAWNCEYETVEECLPSVTSGNRGLMSPDSSSICPVGSRQRHPQKGAARLKDRRRLRLKQEPARWKSRLMSHVAIAAEAPKS